MTSFPTARINTNSLSFCPIQILLLAISLPIQMAVLMFLPNWRKRPNMKCYFQRCGIEVDQNNDSPGYVLADSVAKLYEKLKANPEQYPRGLLVRILLGNPPVLTIEEFNSQVYYVFEDLRDAGVDKLVDPDIGWRVEVANFEGALPHSHSKVMIVDGENNPGSRLQYAI